MGKPMPGARRALESKIFEGATTDRAAKRQQAITRRDQIMSEKMDERGLPADDGIPPNPPTGVTVLPHARALLVDWNIAPLDDQLEGTRIRVVDYGDGVEGAETAHYTTQREYRVNELEAHLYRVYLRHVDRFGLESAEVGPYEATPNPSVADEVDLERTRIIGELGYENIEQLTDAAKLGAGVVTEPAIRAGAVTTDRLAANAVVASKMAAGDAIFINAWIQDLAVPSAKIAEIAADKIRAGIINVEIEIAGNLRAGGFRANAGGAQLVKTAGGIGRASQDTGSAVTPEGEKFARLGFFDNASFGKGASLVVEGTPGRFDFYATWGTRAFSDVSGAYILAVPVQSGRGAVTLGNYLLVTGAGKFEGGLSVGAEGIGTDGGATIGNGLTVNGNSVLADQGYAVGNKVNSRYRGATETGVLSIGANGSQIQHRHGREGTTWLAVVQAYLAGGWRPIVDSVAGFRVFYATSDGEITVTNNNTFSTSVRIAYYG